MKCKFIWQGYVEGCSGSTFAQLDQIQLFGPFDSRPASLDVEFAVDALGMGADRAQGDHEFVGDLRPGKLGIKQTENFKLTLGQRLNQIFDGEAW